jgi:hypothetical protein
MEEKLKQISRIVFWNSLLSRKKKRYFAFQHNHSFEKSCEELLDQIWIYQIIS